MDCKCLPGKVMPYSAKESYNECSLYLAILNSVRGRLRLRHRFYAGLACAVLENIKRQGLIMMHANTSLGTA